jgi:hypothetical protein
MAGKGWGALTSLFIQKTDEEPVTKKTPSSSSS